jgi:hypothetical protein
MKLTVYILRSARDRSLEESLDALLGEVWTWCEGREPDDDVSILGVETVA